MSLGGSIPYHLRHNKAIERNLFIDLLARIGRHFNISDYRYVGFGGPFLEDFKHLHSALRITDMVSLEIDGNVYQRQKFNKPVACISLREESSSDFLNTYDFDGAENLVVWLDYASTEISTQLQEVQRLVEKLGHGDVFKVTVNASPVFLGHADAGRGMPALRLAKARLLLGDYAPAIIEEADVSTKKFPALLLKAIVSAAKHGLAGDSKLVMQPLASFVYSDGQQMLTFTGILIEPSERESIFESTRLKHWPFYNDCAGAPTSISVPVLSMKERVHVESMLPGATAQDILQNLEYYVGSDRKSATAEMENFISFYRMFPWYSRVVV
ncbi:O-methyltransferase [Pseudomonas mosselii]|uniref:Uncharacterized protein n=1 Tax=Pseudomonas mosselii TaxID=78327 RepID=A0AA42S1N5_9PSED|nr:O-methyltransferase [Pseudomonas mosselii]MDH1632285.1 hypothetical protein [Pseudomonas mosselii]